MWPFDDIGGLLGADLSEVLASAFEKAMDLIWRAAVALLMAAFRLADEFSVFSVDTDSGPVGILWPLMLWISGVLAVGLFLWQLIMTMLRGGRGFLRLVGGPIQYGIALAVTVGMVGSFLAAVDGLTDGILWYGLRSENFAEALEYTTFADGAVSGVKAVVLGICAVVGVVPVALGYLLEMLFRQAAIYVLVATVPIVAAGLLANVSAHWFWRTCRWLLATIAMKPVLALTLVLGVAIAGGSDGLSGLLAGIGVLIISLICPFVLFKLFAFVDPNTDAGATFRDAMATGVGMSSFGSSNPAMVAASGAVGGSGGGGALEQANTGRFDAAVDGAQADDASAGDTGADTDRAASVGATLAGAAGGEAAMAVDRGGDASGGQENPPPEDGASGAGPDIDREREEPPLPPPDGGSAAAAGEADTSTVTAPGGDSGDDPGDVDGGVGVGDASGEDDGRGIE